VRAEALDLIGKTGQCYNEAELYRLQGEWLLKQPVPDVSQAETCFQQALFIARRQQGKESTLSGGGLGATPGRG
jgi:hypothetical protein